MKILFYQPYNQIVVYIESVLEHFAKAGHETYFISHAEKGETHKNLEKFGCKTFSLMVERKSFFQYYTNRIFKLASFCKENKIDIVYSHFQEANLIAVISQFFCGSHFIITRHHSDSAFTESNSKEQWADRIINRLATNYIATSRKVYDQMVTVEGTRASKVTLVNYGYNFNSFKRVDLNAVEQIKKTYPSRLILVAAARFIREKRHHELLAAAEELIAVGIDFKLLLLGHGPLQYEIAELIKSKKLDGYVYFIGFKINVMDYYAAADLVVHFSISEASNSAIKEAAITCTTVAVCTDVGDFDDYITHGQNGFLLDKENPQKDFVELMNEINNGKFDLNQMAENLYKEVIARFDINNVMHQYEDLNESVLRR